MKLLQTFVCLVAAAILAGCAVQSTPPAQVEQPAPRAEQAQAQVAVQTAPKRVLKRKIAIGRFTNETRYGRSLLVDENNNPLGKQAADILTARLVETGQFLVLERTDLNIVKGEQANLGEANIVGADTLIVGSVTEFGRTTTGKKGFLSSTKVQTAKAKIEIRLVDVRTGQAFFATSGAGEASTESGEVMGFGSQADYDGTLNDRAIAAAISDFLGKLLTKLDERAWRTDVLKVDGNQVIIAAGERQGLKVGDVLEVFKRGDSVKNPSTGFMIELPATPIGKVQVAALFGDSETSEGAVTTLIAGTAVAPNSTVFVAEPKGK
jgi:curli biogenesis system outer membrane secretion channel CsgG